MKHVILRFSYSCLLSLSIASGMAVGQELRPASALSTVAIAGATIAEWRGAIHLSLPGQPVSNPLRGEQLPAGTILGTGCRNRLFHFPDGSDYLIMYHTSHAIPQPPPTPPHTLQHS